MSSQPSAHILNIALTYFITDLLPKKTGKTGKNASQEL